MYHVAINEMMSAQFTFTADDILKYKMLTHKVEMPLTAIKEVRMKANAFLGTLGIQIRYEKNGKIKNLQKIESKASDNTVKPFLEELKNRIPETAQWNDLREQNTTVSTNEFGREVFPLQYLPFGYSGAGLPRGLQIGLIWGIFSLAIFGIPVLLYMIFKKSYMVEADEDYLIIRKMSEKRYRWDEVKNMEFQPVHVTQNSVAKNQLMKYKVILQNGRKRKFIMRDFESKPFMQILADKGFINKQEVEEYFV